GKSKIAKSYMEHFDELKNLPSQFVISMDHMKKGAFPLAELEMSHLERFRDVKKAEFLIGLHLSPEDTRTTDGDKLIQTGKGTFETLIPFYRLAMGAI